MFIEGKQKLNINIVVARHGSTILNELGKYQGSRFNYPLTSKGNDEIQMLKKEFDRRNYKFDSIITSEFIRAKETAEILTGKPRDSFVVDPRLNPCDIGEADGKSESELFTIFRYPVLAKDKEKFLSSYLKRIRMFLRDTLSKYNGKTILIVTHEDITGLMDAYLSNYIFLKGPHNGIMNGNARAYHIQDIYEADESPLSKIDPRKIHFHGPLNVITTSEDITTNSSQNNLFDDE